MTARARARNAFRVAAAIAYVPAFVLPVVLVRGWSAGAVVAWAILSVPVAAFAGGLVAIFFDDTPVNTEPRPLPESNTGWPEIGRMASYFSAGAGLLGVLVSMLMSGFGAFTESATYGVTAFLIVLAAVIAVLVGRFGMMTKADVRAMTTRRRRRRHGRPRDLARLGSADEQQRRAWFRSLRRRAKWVAGVRIVLSLPLLGVAVLAGADETDGWPTFLRIGTTVIAVAVGLGLAVGGVASSLRDPLLLVGRVTEGLYGVAVVAGQTPGLKEKAWTFIEHGAFREITVEVDAACAIPRHGELRARPQARGEQVLAGRRRLVRRAIEGERAVIVCAGRSPAMGLLGDLVRT